jgi:hypothetical protein
MKKMKLTLAALAVLTMSSVSMAGSDCPYRNSDKIVKDSFNHLLSGGFASNTSSNTQNTVPVKNTK